MGVHMPMTNLIEKNNEVCFTSKDSVNLGQCLWYLQMNHEHSEMLIAEPSHILHISIRQMSNALVPRIAEPVLIPLKV